MPQNTSVSFRSKRELDKAKIRSGRWDREFGLWLATKGLSGYAGWDKLPAEKRAELEALWEEGHNMITRDKLEGKL